MRRGREYIWILTEKTTYYLRKSDEGKSILFYYNRYSSSSDVYNSISETNYSEEEFEFKKKFLSRWKYIKLDAEYPYKPAIFSVDRADVE